MKRFLPLIIILFFSVINTFAQAPKGINYQGVARDNEGNPYSSKTISVRIGILKNAANGEIEYSEIHKPQTNQFGLFTLVIGQGTKITGDFAFISWAVGNKWLQIEIDPNGGSTFTLAGSQQLMTVPYAFYAEYAGSGGGGTTLTAGQGISITNGVISNTGDADNSTTNELQNLSDVLTKSNNAGGTKITNLGAPVAAADAATKSYVDAQNALDLDKDPTNELQNLSQVLSKGTDAGGNKIQNVAAPTANTDVTNKLYVDNAIARNFAFKAKFDFANTTGAQILSQTVPLSTEDIDLFNVIGSNTFTAQDAGIYVFTVEGSYQYANPSSPALYLVVNGVQNPAAIVSPVGGGDPKYNSTFMFILTAGQKATLLMEFFPNTARFIGTFFGYKL